MTGGGGGEINLSLHHSADLLMPPRGGFNDAGSDACGS